MDAQQLPHIELAMEITFAIVPGNRLHRMRLIFKTVSTAGIPNV
jgi:hypothetical protein